MKLIDLNEAMTKVQAQKRLAKLKDERKKLVAHLKSGEAGEAGPGADAALDDLDAEIARLKKVK